MSKENKPNPFDEYPKQVATGLGFPNDRVTVETAATGWLLTSADDLRIVSRETSTQTAKLREGQL